MKKLFVLSSLALCFSINLSFAQSNVIGYINADGIYELSIAQSQGKNILKQHSIPTEAQPFEATDISITQMEDGTLCLTGYLKNPGGHIVKGFRIQCIQDDENNLIVKPGNKRERVIGKPF